MVANNGGYQVKGDVKINGQAASLDYRKPSEGDADLVTATRFNPGVLNDLDDTLRPRIAAAAGVH